MKQVFRILLIEDSQERIDQFRAWVPDGTRIVEATSAGQAMGLLKRDSNRIHGRVYAGILLDHDLHQQTKTATDAELSSSDLVDLIETHIDPDVPVLIHSVNAQMAPVLHGRLERADFCVDRVPFDQLTESEFLEWLQSARELHDDLLDE